MTIRRWLVPSPPATHLLMDGGILHVPHEEADEFFRTYIQEVRQGTKLYVVEQKTERFRFFVDIDYKAPEKLSEEKIENICRTIHSVVSKGRCCIARARPRPCTEGIKTGVHVHFPDVVVTKGEALSLRTRILLALDEKDPSLPWSQIIDASVYGGSGLRMLWSHKKPTGDPYIPWKSLGGEIFSKEPDTGILELFSIRTLAETTEEPCELSLEDSEPLERFIRTKFVGQEDTRVKRVIRHEHNGWYIQSNSKYCERISDRHKSNHVWFSVRQGGIISQKCFDEDCKEFSGREHNLPPSIVEKLKNVTCLDSSPDCAIMDFLPPKAKSLYKINTPV
jgi:hypothetical protein